jgi:hypothetical protein
VCCVQEATYVSPHLLYANTVCKGAPPPPCGEQRRGLTARDSCRTKTEQEKRIGPVESEKVNRTVG